MFEDKPEIICGRKTAQLGNFRYAVGIVQQQLLGIVQPQEGQVLGRGGVQLLFKFPNQPGMAEKDVGGQLIHIDLLLKIASHIPDGAFHLLAEGAQPCLGAVAGQIMLHKKYRASLYICLLPWNPKFMIECYVILYHGGIYMQIAIMGFGTIGSGVAELLMKNKKSTPKVGSHKDVYKFRQRHCFLCRFVL